MADYLALSVETAGMEKHRDAVMKILSEEMQPLGIYERSEGPGTAIGKFR